MARTTRCLVIGPTKRYAAFFAADPLLATQFANQGTGDSEAEIGQRVIPAYISLTNPLDFTKGITNEQEEALVSAGMNKQFAYELATAKADEAWEYFDEDRGGEENVKIMKAAGFDGAILTESFPGVRNTKSYAVFTPTQIKSAIANSGAFGKTNPQIQFSPAVSPDGLTLVEKRNPVEQEENFIDYATGFAGLSPYQATESWNNKDATYARWRRRLYEQAKPCLLYTSPSPRDGLLSRMPSSA